MTTQLHPIHIYRLIEFSEEVISFIQNNHPDKQQYFITLVYIEDILDKYGRGLIAQSIDNDDARRSAVRTQINSKLEALRLAIRDLNAQHEFDEIIRHSAKSMQQAWIQPETTTV